MSYKDNKKSTPERPTQNAFSNAFETFFILYHTATETEHRMKLSQVKSININNRIDQTDNECIALFITDGTQYIAGQIFEADSHSVVIKPTYFINMQDGINFYKKYDPQIIITVESIATKDKLVIERWGNS